MGRYRIIDQDKIDIQKAKTLDNAGVLEMMSNALLSEEETEAIFKSVWNTADERCCDEWENKEYGSGSDSLKMDWEQFKKTL